MKVFLSTHFYPNHGGGIEIAAYRIARALADKGIIINWTASDCDSPPPEYKNINYFPLPNNNFIEKKFPFPYPFPGKKSKKIIRELIAESDIIHLHDYIYAQNIFSAKVALEMNKPYIITQHIGNVAYKNPLFNILLKTLNKRLGVKYLEKAAKVVFISRNVEEYFRGKSRNINAEFIPNPTDISQFKPIDREDIKYKRKMFGVPENALLVLFVGRFTEKKGLNVVKAIAARMPGVFFLLVGKGSINPATWGYGNVLTAGNFKIEDMPHLYNIADLFLLPSWGEGFPLVIQEALACGLPVVTSKENSTAHEFLPEHICAVDNPDPASAENWALAIVNAMRGESEVRRSARINYIKQHFSIDSCADSYIKLFNSIKA